METDWKTKLLALHANNIVMGNMRQHRIESVKKFKSHMAAKESPIEIVSPDYMFKEHYDHKVYKEFIQSAIAREMQACNIPTAHVVWMLDTLKKLTVEERRQFLKTLPGGNNKFTARHVPMHMFTTTIVISSLLNDKDWKQNYNALRDFVYPKNRNTTTQAQ